MVPFAHKGQVRAIDDLIPARPLRRERLLREVLRAVPLEGEGLRPPREFGNQDIYYNTAVWDGAGNKRPPYDWDLAGVDDAGVP